MARAQTPHDYLVGVSIMLLTLFGVFAFVPGIFAPFEAPVEAEETAIADRIGDHLVAAHALAGAENTLSGAELRDTLSDDAAFEALLDRSGVDRDVHGVNVTVVHPNGTRLDEGWGMPAAERDYRVNATTAATTIRFVRIDGVDDCETACRLVVRVW